jgi:CO/xanthine dehydrogenase FAD-binding subunit
LTRRFDVTAKTYFLPQSLGEALSLLAEHGPSLLVMAGGTLAMPLINKGISMPEKVLGLRRAGLDYIHPSNGSLQIGATATLSQVLQHERIPVLQQAAHNVGSWAVRNMGTAGGNLFAPPPAGDLTVALLALDARVKLASLRGERIVPLAEFYAGFLSTVLAPDELVVELEVPLPRGMTTVVKHGRLHTNTPTIVGVAVHVVKENGRVREARVALNGVGPHPIRARNAEAAILGSPLDAAAIVAASDAAAQECEPFTDPVSSDWYRRKMTGVFVRRALTQVAQ